MRHYWLVLLSLVLLAEAAVAAPKAHLVSFGNWMPAKWFVGADESQAVDLKVRALYVDGRLREFTLGTPRDVTDRLFVVRRAFRLNDNLPDETTAVPHWRWQRGGWLLVDRVTCRVTPVSLPEFDPYYSAASWYRDYVAYCGVSDGGKKVHAMVVQLGRRKPVLRKLIGDAPASDLPDSACPAPKWQRQPSRVTFEPDKDPKFTYSVREHAVDPVNQPQEEDEEEGTQ
jgi:hypothetical protein